MPVDQDLCLPEWPLSLPEADVLDWVHRRANVIGRRRVIARAVPVLAAAVAVVFALTATSNSPVGQSIRAADDGDEAGRDSAIVVPRTHNAFETANVGSGHNGIPDKGASMLEPNDLIGLGLPTPLPPPVEPAPTSSTGQHPSYLVEDPEGDELPENEGLDLRYGDIDYMPGPKALRFVSGVTRLSAAPEGVSYHWTFSDEESYDVQGFRPPGEQPYVDVQRERCASCSMTFDLSRNESVIVVPLEVLNRYVTETRSDNGESSPPVAKGRTFGSVSLRAYAVGTGGTLDLVQSPLGANDKVERSESWTVR